MILNPLYNRPNYVVEKQRAIQSDTRPVMLRLPRSKLYVGSFGALFTVGMFATVYGITSLVKGKQSSE
ncbi:hypothetical protein AMATHDRAFT_61587 [Amanita thiersii Skay4041]|uniref:Cytochrome c oxidase assembly factor 3 n=1 Tax=Amanita thiersii Skay4041 TaxID=703135 RepID=A0A2A9NR18_9AGAR|nr:hypothetical protein AMATHDRAFT_61587 [Amanita thiersii Skay4041]